MSTLFARLAAEDPADKLQSLQRQLDREKRYNAELLKENEVLKQELSRFKGEAKTDAECQTEFVDPVEGETQWVSQAQEQGGSIAESVRSFLTNKHSENERKDFVYNEALGMYWNPNSGMMYDGKRYLYYDYNTKVYMYYDEETKSYKEDPTKNPKPGKRKRPKKEVPLDSDILSASSSEEEGEVDEDNRSPNADSFPPCVRIIIFRSSVLTAGDLYIATCDRPFTIGRDPKRDMVLEEDSVSKYHAVINYDKDTGEYKLQDYGSQNGTTINGERLSEPKAVSEKKTIEHLDVVAIGSTILVLHIHEGSDTCDKCEPGVMRSFLQNSDSVASIINNVTDSTLKELHKQEIMQIKRKYGLQKDHFVAAHPSGSPDYVDRSRMRRINVGSEHPSTVREAESASVHVAISGENKGFKMLAKMGWNEGEGLNKDRRMDALNEPLAPMVRLNETAGLGAEGVGEQMSMDDVKNRQQKEKWAKTAKRYHGLPTTNMYDKAPESGASQSGNIRWVRGGVTNGQQPNPQ